MLPLGALFDFVGSATIGAAVGATTPAVAVGCALWLLAVAVDSSCLDLVTWYSRPYTQIQLVGRSRVQILSHASGHSIRWALYAGLLVLDTL